MTSAMPTPASPMIIRRARRLIVQNRFTTEFLRSRHQPVAGAAYRDQTVIPDLAPQVADVDLDSIGRNIGGTIPHVIEQLSLADHPTGVADQILQQHKLPRGPGSGLLR